jgi:hypothetical protein
LRLAINPHNILNKVLLLIAFLLTYNDVTASIQSDTIAYDLIVHDEVIGNMIAIVYHNQDSTFYYRIESNVDYTLLFSFHINFLYTSSFSSSGLYNNSSFKYTMNDDIKEYNWVNLIDDKWYVYENYEVKEIIEEQIHQTAVQLYFEKPDARMNVFSERFCGFYPIELEDDGGFKIEFPGGTNRYYYDNGTCNRIEINTIFSDMEFIKQTKD